MPFAMCFNISKKLKNSTLNYSSTITKTVIGIISNNAFLKQ